MPESTPDSAFDSQELEFLVRFLDTGFGRISAAVVPGPAVGSALLGVLRERLPGQVFRIEDTEPPVELDPIALGERAEEASRSGEIFVLPLDGRQRPIDSNDEADFWRRMNYQRERLAKDEGRTLFLLDEQAEACLTGFADDLHDWVRTFHFHSSTLWLPLSPFFVQPDSKRSRRQGMTVYDPDDLNWLRSQLQRARQQGLPETQISRLYAVPLLTALVASHQAQEAAEIWDRELRAGEALEPLRWPVDQIVYVSRIGLAELKGDRKGQGLWTERYLRTAEEAVLHDGTAQSILRLLDAINRRGWALLGQQRFTEAIKEFERGLAEVELQKAVLGEESADQARAQFLGSLRTSGRLPVD